MVGEKRVVNFRPLVFIALSILLSVFAAFYADKIYIVIISFAALSALLIYAALKGKAVTLALMVVTAVFSFLQVNLSQNSIPSIIPDTEYLITCRAGERIEHYDDSVEFYINGFTFEAPGTDAVKASGSFTVSLPVKNANDPLYYAQCGDILSFNAKLKLSVPKEKRAAAYYITFTSVSGISVTAGKASFPESVRLKTKLLLGSVAPPDTAALMYSVLYGDTDGLSLQTYTSFKFSGLAHVLAVSGLHVGMLCYSLFWAMKKFRANNAAILAVTAAALLFYCFLCSFTPSVVRASVMAVVFLSAKTLKRRYDSLNSLAFAAAVILLCRPSALLSLSFQMSFMCMLSIIALMPVIMKLFETKRLKTFYGKNKFTKSACQIFALSLAAQAGVLPLMINNFNYVAVYNLLINIIVAPLLTVAVYLLYATVFLSLLLPFMSFSVYASAAAFAAVKWLASLFSYLPFAAITVLAGGALLYALYLLITVCGRFVMLGKKVKWGVAALSVLLFLTAAVMGNIPLKTTPSISALDHGYKNGTIVISGKSAVYAGDVTVFNTGKIKEFLFERHIRSMDAVVLTAFKEADAYYLGDLVNTFKPAAVYVPDTGSVTGYGALADACAYSEIKLIKGAEEFAAGEIAVTAAVNNGRLIGVNFGMRGKNITVLYERSYDEVYKMLWALPAAPDLLIAKESGLEDKIPCKEFFLCYNYTEFYGTGAGNFTYSLE